MLWIDTYSVTHVFYSFGLFEIVLNISSRFPFTGFFLCSYLLWFSLIVFKRPLTGPCLVETPVDFFLFSVQKYTYSGTYLKTLTSSLEYQSTATIRIISHHVHQHLTTPICPKVLILVASQMNTA